LSALAVDDDGRVTLALSTTSLRLREPLAGLALRVADDARARASLWLFPAARATGLCPRTGSANDSLRSASNGPCTPATVP
jgi:hypothetical protein